MWAYQLHRVFFALAFVMLFYLQNACAKEADKPSFYSPIKDTVSQTWANQLLSFIIRINTWHNQHYFRAEKIDGFNERPWGLRCRQISL